MKWQPQPQPYTAARPWLSGPGLRLALLFVAVSLFLGCAVADCECGYSATVDGTRHVFTDLIESDFTRVGDIADDTDWRRQAFNESSERARGDFGEMFAVDNVDAGEGADEGLQLLVRGQEVDDMVPGAEIDTARTDVLWGTFRASMKLTSVSGTCAAFFWVSRSSQGMLMLGVINKKTGAMQ